MSLFVVCLFWNSGSWATADQTYNGRRFLLFALLGCEGTFLGSFLFFIIIMVANTSDGVQVILFLLRRALGGWDPVIEKRQSRRI